MPSDLIHGTVHGAFPLLPRTRYYLFSHLHFLVVHTFGVAESEVCCGRDRRRQALEASALVRRWLGKGSFGLLNNDELISATLQLWRQFVGQRATSSV